MSVGLVSATSPSNSNIPAPALNPPSLDFFTQAKQSVRIKSCSFFTTPFEEGEASLDRGLSYCQKRRPCLYYRPAENGKLEKVGEFISKGMEGDKVEEDQATLVDLTSLLKWTKEDAMLNFPTPVLLARGDEYTELDKFLKSSSQHVLLLGQPGIGL